MEAGPEFFQRGSLSGRSFGEKEKLPRLLSLAPPDVVGLHGGKNLDAGGGPGLQSGLSEADGKRFCVHRSEEYNDSHFSFMFMIPFTEESKI